MNTKRDLRVLITTFVVLSTMLFACAQAATAPVPTEVSAPSMPTAAPAAATKVPLQKPSIPEIPKVTVKFAALPYMDTTFASVAMAQGWFQEVGITIQPKMGDTVPFESINAVTLADQYDVASCFVPALVPVQKDAGDIRPFFLSNEAYGFAITCASSFKTIADFEAGGLDPQKALAASIQQLKGKKLIYENAPSDTSFLALAFKKGGISWSDFSADAPDTRQHLTLMYAGKADCEIDGIPQRLTLQSHGFKPIVTARDLLIGATGSPDSEELNAIGTAGWATSRQYEKNNMDTILRFAGVGYRTLDFINNQSEAALNIWVPFYNSISGTNFAMDDARLLINPLVTDFAPFERQATWFQDPTDPTYYKNWIGAQLKLAESQGTYKTGEVTPDDVIDAQNVYAALSKDKDDAKYQIDAAQAKITSSSNAALDFTQAKQLLDQATHFYDTRAYLDASRFGTAANEWADYTIALSKQ